MLQNLVALGLFIIAGAGYWAAVPAKGYTAGLHAQFPFLARFCRWCGVMITGGNAHLHGKHCTRRRRWTGD